MKSKILSLLFALVCFSAMGAVFAEVDTEQAQYLSDTKATIAVQKQPNYDKNQRQNVKNNWFCIVIQVNGKFKDTDTSDTGNR